MADKNQDRKEKKNDAVSTELENIEKSSSVIASNSRESIYCLSIIGQVEGHYILPDGQKATKDEQLIPLLVSVEENDGIDGLLIVLNTMGGDVEAGLALAEMIASMKKPTVSLVIGGGHSIGVPLAVSARKSFIVPSASMTVHPVRMSGTMIAAPQTYNYFDRLQERIVEFVTSHSRISRKDFLALMLKTGELSSDVGSVLYGREAVSKGLIDRVGGLSDALAELYRQIDENREKEQD